MAKIRTFLSNEGTSVGFHWDPRPGKHDCFSTNGSYKDELAWDSRSFASKIPYYWNHSNNTDQTSSAWTTGTAQATNYYTSTPYYGMAGGSILGHNSKIKAHVGMYTPYIETEPRQYQASSVHTHGVSLVPNQPANGWISRRRTDGKTEIFWIQGGGGSTTNYYQSRCLFWRLADNETMMDTKNIHTNLGTSGTAGYNSGGQLFAYHEGSDKYLSMTMSGNNGSYGDYHSQVYHWSPSSGGQFSSSEGQVYTGMRTLWTTLHFLGMSEVDGNPIFLQLESGQAFLCRVYKLNPAGNGTVTTLFSDNSDRTTWDIGAGYGGRRSAEVTNGTDDQFGMIPTQWVENSSGYRSIYFPYYDQNNSPFPCHLRWNKANDTFELRGGNASSTYAGPTYTYDGNGQAPNASEMGGILTHPALGGYGDNRTINTGMCRAASVLQMHGADNDTNDWRTRWAANDYTHTYLTAFNCHGSTNAYNGGGAVNRLMWYLQQDPDYFRFQGYIDLPETIRNFAWLNERQTRLALIGANNVYIYKFIGYNVGTNLNASSIPGSGTSPINNLGSILQNNTTYGWILTATIPGKVTQLYVDKYDRINVMQSSTNVTQSCEHHIYSNSTPAAVVLAGNVTTDTITYSGSNINKTLTIEAKNLFNERVEASINLLIHGDDMEFDNGLQTKTVTTSASGTISETVTITGSGTSRITASFGA